MVGAILEQKTGKSIYELFQENIARPLGMQDYRGEHTTIDGEAEDVAIPETDGFYQYERSKSLYPAYHFRLSARDLALYGQLYLQEGVWQGTQVVLTEWIEASTQPYSIYNEQYGIGYGMLWYVLVENENRPTRSFFHTGAGVHMLGIYPGLKLVLVHRVDTEKETSFRGNDLYQMIDLVFGALLE